jgi:hypothetical protein
LHTRTCNLRLLIGAPDCMHPTITFPIKIGGRLLGVFAFFSALKMESSVCLDWIFS